MESADVLDILQQLGFSPNEAKVYLGLINLSPLNGYEAAKASGVTRTMIYDILNRLVGKGFVRRISSEPTLYCAVNQNELIEKIECEQRIKLERAKDALSKMNVRSDDAYYVFNFKGGPQQLFEQLNAQIRGARESVYLSIWDFEAQNIREELKKAEKRGVQIFIFSFTKIPFRCGTQCCYEISGEDGKRLDQVNDRFASRRVAAVFDQQTLVIGTGNGTDNDVNILTGNPMLVSMTIDQIILDMLLLKTMKKYGGYCAGMSAAEHEALSEQFQLGLHLPDLIPQQPRRSPVQEIPEG
jgi:DNA-binding MarR family transcriptional regulator